uniref:Cid1 n=1 Tax=Drosophila rufa TaxID=67533 RepID=A0A1V0HRJ4_9MUSC|nr:Cid1 [Drosophila rufa]ARC76840.1 Cid1 [Drosophila rufa]
MRTLRVKESQSKDDSSTDSSSSGSLEQLDDHLASSTSRLMLQDANTRSSATLRTRSNRAEPDQENRPPQTPSQRQERGAPAPAPATLPPPRRRKQRGPLSRANQMEREIRRLRNRTVPLIPKLPFSRAVREVMFKLPNQTAPRITEGALQVLQESTELYLTQRFEDAYLLTHHRGRVTLEVRDMILMAYLIDVSHCRS